MLLNGADVKGSFGALTFSVQVSPFKVLYDPAVCIHGFTSVTVSPPPKPAAGDEVTVFSGLIQV